MNYKKVITAILLVSDGSINHTYFQENFSLSKDDLIKIFDDINTELNENDYGFYIKYDENSSDFATLDFHQMLLCAGWGLNFDSRSGLYSFYLGGPLIWFFR